MLVVVLLDISQRVCYRLLLGVLLDYIAEEYAKGKAEVCRCVLLDSLAGMLESVSVKLLDSSVVMLVSVIRFSRTSQRVC